jgi:hypothetical protein
VGVVVDTYHVWWDARLADEIARAGRRIVSFQVCDWVLPLPADTLLGRGHLGDGCIDFAPIAASVAAAGYHGDVEVEIFNAEVWDTPPDQTATTVKERFAAVLGLRHGCRVHVVPATWVGHPRLMRERSACITSHGSLPGTQQQQVNKRPALASLPGEGASTTNSSLAAGHGSGEVPRASPLRCRVTPVCTV